MSVRTYSIVFAILIGSTAGELFLIGQPIRQDIMVATIIGLAGVKAVLIAMFFQHLKDEPRPLSTLVLLPLIGAIVLITISMVSIQAFT